MILPKIGRMNLTVFSKKDMEGPDVPILFEECFVDDLGEDADYTAYGRVICEWIDCSVLRTDHDRGLDNSYCHRDHLWLKPTIGVSAECGNWSPWRQYIPQGPYRLGFWREGYGHSMPDRREETIEEAEKGLWHWLETENKYHGGRNWNLQDKYRIKGWAVFREVPPDELPYFSNVLPFTHPQRNSRSSRRWA